MEGEDSVRTVECLRGRLLAERAASRSAKEEAANWENKLMQLEMLLKQEAKSRNRAEKKLKSLMKKLESINISHASDESDYSGLRDKSDISSISSSTSSTIKQPQEEENSENRNTNNISAFETLESKENMRSQKNDSQNCLFSLSDESSTAEGSSISGFEANLSGKEHKTGRFEDLQQSLSQSDMCCDESIQEDNHQDSDSQVDDPMALVVVDKPQKSRPIDPKVLDATVKEVLDALRYAKEQLQLSMERRRMNSIGVG